MTTHSIPSPCLRQLRRLFYTPAMIFSKTERGPVWHISGQCLLCQSNNLCTTYLVKCMAAARLAVRTTGSLSEEGTLLALSTLSFRSALSCDSFKGSRRVSLFAVDRLLTVESRSVSFARLCVAHCLLWCWGRCVATKRRHPCKW